MKKLVYLLLCAGMSCSFLPRSGAMVYIMPELLTDNGQKKEQNEEDVPHFEQEEANKGIAEFKAIMDQFGPGLRTNDATAIQGFSARIAQWSSKSQDWMAKLSPEEHEKFNAFFESTARKYAPQPPVMQQKKQSSDNNQ